MAIKSVATKTVAGKTKVLATQKAAPQKDGEAPEKDAPDTPDAPLPLLDLSDAAVRKMIKAAKKRGYVTHDQVNAVLPSEEVTSDQIEDVFAMLNEMGINVIETEEAETEETTEEAREEPEEEESEGELVEVARTTPAETKKSEPGEREIAIAKRIEAGREAMIAGLCESPLTFQAIIIWRDELNDGKVFLRDIIDLEATYAGPDAKNAPSIAPGDGGGNGAAPQPQPTVAPSTAPAAATPFRVKSDPVGEDEEPVEAPEGELDEDDLEGSMSLAAIEAELKPKVLETFDKVADSTSGCAGCRTRTSSSSSRAPRSRPTRSASTRSSRKRSSPR